MYVLVLPLIPFSLQLALFPLPISPATVQYQLNFTLAGSVNVRATVDNLYHSQPNQYPPLLAEILRRSGGPAAELVPAIPGGDVGKSSLDLKYAQASSWQKRRRQVSIRAW